jgi:hypothetical protein
MRAAAPILVLLTLSACDKPMAQQPAPPAPPSEVGRWIIVPASTAGPVFIGNRGANFFAWKLDTKTGELEACTYDAGRPDKPETEEVTCIAERK